MTFEEYQRETGKTVNPALNWEERVLDFGLGIAGEGGEVANKIKKARFHGHGFHAMRYQILDEIGDVIWYAAQLSALFDATLEDVATINITKLRERYPDGFSVDASVNRTS